MTERIDIAKARELLEGTTKGEWRVVQKGNSVPSHAVATTAYDGEPQINVCSGISPKTGNALWIAHAHNTYAALLDELEGARAETATARGVLCALLQRINEAAEQSTAYVVEPDIERMVANAYQAMLTQEGRT
jgi:hypothetical protein